MTAFCPTLPEAPGARVLAALLRTDRDAGAHDELHGADGRLRPSWQRLFATLPADVADARAEIDARARQLAEEVHADGITHNVHGGTGTRGPARLWPLEALPLIVEPGDWVAIERGVVQRARLLDATMADLYGPQRLLHDALPPATLPYRRPGYLRALHGTVSPGGLHLHIVAFDLARGPDGHWWVVAQCCEDPSGQGHVLHNRLIVSRLFPDAFREPRVQQITSAYRRLLDTVEAQAAEVAAAGSPRIALPTAGPYSETCDEHALLARYLGVPVVEGDDLTVRDDRVFLKTVGGWSRCTRYWAASTTRGATRSSCAPTRRWECPGCWRPCVPGVSSSPTRWAARVSRPRRCRASCRRCRERCSARTWRRPRCRPGGAARPPPRGTPGCAARPRAGVVHRGAPGGRGGAR